MEGKLVDRLHRVLTKPINILLGALLLFLLAIRYGK
jgi:hypothetical protein